MLDGAHSTIRFLDSLDCLSSTMCAGYIGTLEAGDHHLFPTALWPSTWYQTVVPAGLSLQHRDIIQGYCASEIAFVHGRRVT